ncbi:hypothetical protein KUTeg_000359 [Tegillarca granosa]|uniref:Uncharacterized protein n=1 Tax=Tegillarca granosa TaxID=220873 RepID=A0ABQ9FXC5_TEGGR|nr:hypothetical protein KUTeg_000359 [Tegillarca granosa]
MAASNKLTNSGVNIIEIFTKLSHILAIFGFILHLIGFATPFWRVLPFRWKGLNDEDEDNLLGFDEGLWRKCANGLCSSVEVAGRDWLQAVRVFESIALISSMVAIATVLFQMLYYLCYWA